MIRFLAAAAAILLVASTGADATEARIAIIIDDLGYRKAEGFRALSLPGPVAVAILPGTPQSVALAEAADASDKEVLVHLPLQASSDDGLEEPGSITLDMSRRAFRASFEKAVAGIPHVSGINNHRGSLLTRHPGHMRWLMEDILAEDKGLFFVDSYTTHHSVALSIAGEHGVPALKRDVFLDNRRDPESIAHEFQRLKRLARERGAAVAIGHPFPETLDFLERALPGLQAEGIELVPLSVLLETRQNLTTKPAIVALPR